MQCGYLSDRFDIQRGCRQGDPIAPYLFLITILIDQHTNIKGIVHNGKEHKITQYADDTTLTLDGSQGLLIIL